MKSKVSYVLNLVTAFSMVLSMSLTVFPGQVQAAEIAEPVVEAPQAPVAAEVSPVSVVRAQRADVPPPPELVKTNPRVVGPVAPADTRGLPRAPIVDPMKDGKIRETIGRTTLGRVRPVAPNAPETVDPVVQRTTGPKAIPTPSVNFEGVNNVDGVLPPDTNGAVGPNHYVQMVNLSTAIYDKQGNLLYGPFHPSDLWPAGDVCHDSNDGDPVVLYDQLADRWLLTQFALPNYPSGPFYQCIAVSKGPDPTNNPDDWYPYTFLASETKMNDYPKLGVWPDGYYMSANQFATAGGASGAGAWVFERDKMLNGEAASMQYFDIADWGYWGLLPSNLAGPTPPPPGTPNYFASVDMDWTGTDDIFHIFAFHTDWDNPANSTFRLVKELVVAPFDSDMCGGARSCIPQPGTTVGLDAIADRLMMHLWYRNFGSYDVLVTNHTVDVGGDHAGIRWYEIRNPGSDAFIYQQGTYAPDDEHRWMGSIAMDGAGNIALGYSVSSSDVYPSIRYTGRIAGDPPGEMTLGEGEIIAGSGSQTHTASRWGDYSAMMVDPVDDCTFWYTTEYIETTGSAPWQTRIAAFAFPECLAATGRLQGTITDVDSGDPVVGAEVTAEAARVYLSYSDEEGKYAFPALQPGVYTVTVEAYGYQPKAASGITVTEETTVTQDFQLTPLPTSVVSGTVVDATTGWPLYASIDIDGYPYGPIWTDPATGEYSVALVQGMTYTFTVEAWVDGYLSAGAVVPISTTNQVRDFALQADLGTCDAPGYTPANVAYSEDFEAGDGGYTHAGTNDEWEWGAPTVWPGECASGLKCWGTDLDGNYDDNADFTLTSPVIDLSAYGPGDVLIAKWAQAWHMERGFDYAYAQVSINGGAWTDMWRASTDGDWTEMSYNISAAAGGTVQFRWGLTSDAGVNEYGYYIDDVRIVVGCNAPVNGGLVVGNVYDQGTEPQVGARVQNDSGEETEALETPDDDAVDDAFYTLFSPSGTHVFTATGGYGYGADVRSVSVVTNSVVVQDFHLPPANLYHVEGYVTDANTGWPLYASIRVSGYPTDTVFWTDPTDGYYSLTLAEGTPFVFNVNAWVDGYDPAAVNVPPLTGDTTVNIALQPDALCTAPGYKIANGIVETFESGDVPEGWTVVDNLGNGQVWQFDDPGNRGNLTGGDGGFAIVDSDNYGMSGWQDTELVSPPFDASGLTTVMLEFDTDYNTYSGADYADVDVSVDGGTTWTNVWQKHGADYRGPAHEVVDISALAAGQPDVRVRFHYYNANWEWWWQVDNVVIGNPTCVPPTGGGLVVGNVYDANTGDPLTGALVSNDSGETFEAAETEDEAVDDAFYTLFSPAGSHTFTATMDYYGTVAADVNVLVSDTVGFDFNLPAGILSYAPAALATTVRMGEQVTLTVDLSNTGGVAATYQLFELPGGFKETIPGVPPGHRQRKDFVLEHPTTEEKGTPANPWTPSGDIQLFVDDGSAENSIGLTAGGQFLWLNRFTPDPSDFPFSIDQISILFRDSIAVGDDIELVLWEDTDGDGDPGTGATFLYSQYVTVVNNDGTTWNDYTLDEPVFFSGPGDVLIGVVNRSGAAGYNDFPAAIDQTPPSQERSWIGLYSGDPPDPPTLPAPSAWGTIDSFGLAGNWTLRASGSHGGVDIVWLSESPETGTVADGGHAAFDVIFDSLFVDQPGVYYAQIKVGNDTPYNVSNIPVTMTVVAPESWGKVMGTVTGLGVCDADPAPLEGAEVTIEASSGTSWTLTTDVSGTYGLWLDEAYSPLTITVAAEDYVDQQVVSVTVSGGLSTTVDFDLRLDAPCLSYTPSGLEMTLEAGQNAKVPFTLTNSGAGIGEFQFVEENHGFVPAMPQGGHRTQGAASFEKAPSTGQADLPTGAIEAPLGSLAYAAELLSQNLVSLDTDNPGGMSVIGFTGRDLFAGDFLNGDFTRMYALEYNLNNFVVVDTASGNTTVIGTATPAAGESWSGMAGDPTTGQLYAASTSCSGSTLYTIDPATGTPTQIGAITNADCIIGIAINSAGEVYGLDIVGDNLIYIDKTTGAGTVVGPVGFNANYAQGMDFDESTDTLYLAAYNLDSGAAELRIADTATGNSTLVGTFPAGTEIDAFSIATFSGGGGPADIVPWLAEMPVSGTVAADADFVTQILFDAGVPEAQQPGVYYAQLRIDHNAPNEVVNVPVTLTVTAPDTWGKLHGVVQSLGYCDANPSPLEEATVVVTAAVGGLEWQLTTDVSGTYSVWLDPAYGPFTITVMAEEHEIKVLSGVTVTAQATTTRDVSLRWLKPCFGTEPSFFDVTVPWGVSVTVPFSLTNGGALTGTFNLREQPGGFIPIVRPVILVPTGETYPEGLALGAQEVNAIAQPWTPEGAVDLVLDDGSMESALGVNSSTNAFQFIWLNRFTPSSSDFPFALEHVHIVWPAGEVNPGDAIQLAIYEDTDGDGDPSDATLLATYNVTVQVADDVTWNNYELTPPVELYGPGDVLIAAINRFTNSSVDAPVFPAALDTTASQGRSWVGWWSTDPPDPPVLPPDDTFDTVDNLGLPGNWMIRGSGETIATDIPWLFEDPTSGIVGADSTGVISLTFDTTVTDVVEPGVYTGTLQVLTNDVVNAVFNVPVTMTVDAGTYGKLEGVVSSPDYCDASPAPVPLSNAEVYIEDSVGTTWTLQTDLYGKYSIWLDSADNPYTITVDAGVDYQTGQAVVDIAAGTVVSQNFSLRFLAPCPSVKPPTIHETVSWGMSATVPVSIYNTGAVTFAWQFVEQNLGDDLSGPPGIQSVFFEGFEGAFPPAGWVLTQTGAADDPGWVTTTVAYEGSFAAYHNDDNTTGDAISWMILPQITVPDSGELAFWQVTVYGSWYYQYHGVWISTGTNDPNDFVELEEIPISDGGWTEYIVDLSAYAGQDVYLAFRYEGDWADEWYIDNVAIRTTDYVTWLSEDPTSGVAVPDTGESSVDVTLDSDVPAITQPGDYQAILQVTDGTHAVNVPVMLTVNPDPTWSRLSGVVYSLGACGVNTDTLEGAQVVVQGGDPVTLTSDADGSYGYWLPAGTYTITVTAADHLSATAVVTVTAGISPVQDFYLPWVGPCFSDLSPTAIEVTVDMGMTDTVPMTLTNAGLGDMDWSVGILPLLSEDFEGTFPPAGWTVIDNAGTGMVWHRNDYFGVANGAAFGSGYAAVAYAYGSGAAWDTELWSPPVLLPDGAVLTYASNFQDYAGNGDMWLDISTDGGATWTNLRYQTSDDPVGGTFETEDLSDYAGQTVILRWRYSASSTTAWYWFVDEVSIAVKVPWLSVDPAVGTADPVSRSVTAVNFDAGQVDAPGDYYATLLVETDDPSNPSATVPVTMHVNLPSTYGRLEGVVTSKGYCDGGSSPVAGAEVLIEGQDGASWNLTADISGTFGLWIDQAHSPLTITVNYTDHQQAQLSGVMITGTQTTTVNVAMRWLKPCVSVAPTSLTAQLELGFVKSVPFTVTNSGAVTLTWSLKEAEGGFMPMRVQHVPQTYAVVEDKTADSESGTGVGPDVSGGPDPFGYTFKDSNEPDGPAYDWVEIAPPEGGSGISAGLAGADDEHVWPIDLPFTFNFYGTDYTQLAFGSNGTVYFEDEYLGLSNVAIPGTNGYGVDTFIAHYWDDLKVDTDGDVYYLDAGDRFIIEYYHVRRYGTSDPGTWEIILFANGSILMQYQDAAFGSAAYDYGGSATVGIQGDPTTGLQYSYNTAALSDGLAICFAYPGADCSGGMADIPWLTEVPTNGVAGPEATSPVTITFDAGVPEVEQPGEYYGTLTLESDDPFSDSIAIPVTMTVIAPASWANIRGVVAGLDACGQNRIPLEGAEVTIEGLYQETVIMPYSVTLTTDADGFYSYWLDDGWMTNSVTINVSYAGYPDDGATFSFDRGEVITQNFDLRIEAPCVVVPTEGVAITVAQGATATMPVDLDNFGLVTATFNVYEQNVGRTPLRPWAAGGPDAFGYTYADSNQAGVVPAFAFVDIADVGTPLTLGDDDFAQIPIGFGFRFYGEDALHPNVYNEVYVGSNGYLSFGSGSVDLSPDDMPNPALPNNLIAAMWSDLKPGTVYYETFDNCPYSTLPSALDACLVVQYDGFTWPDGSDAGTWQVILFRSGNILMQFANVNGAQDVTTGIEDALGIVGLEYAGAPVSELAVCFAYPGQTTDCQSKDIPWLTAEPVQGEVAPEASGQTVLVFDAGVPEANVPGVYVGLVQIATDSPITPTYVIPVTMTVQQFGARLEGTVVGWGRCEAVSQTLEGVAVRIESASGKTWYATTDADGAYSIWLDEGEGGNPYTVTVDVDGYLPYSESADVSITAPTVKDIALYRDLPCMAQPTPNRYQVVVGQGKVVTQTLRLVNRGRGALTADVSSDAPWLSVAPGNDTVPALGSRDLAVVFNAAGLEPKAYYAVIEVQHNDAELDVVRIPVDMLVVAYQPVLTPTVATVSGTVGSTAVYTFSVINSGTYTDTFDVVVAGNAWTATVSSNVVGPLAAGESATFGVQVTIPAAAQVGASDTLTVTVTSRGDNTKSATALLTTTAAGAAGYTVYLPLVMRASP